MIFKEYQNEEEFLKENEYELLLQEDVNNVILGILPQVEKEKVFFRIENGEKIELIGLITKTERKGLIAYIKELEISSEVCEFLVDEMIKRDIDLHEIKAPKGISEIIFNMYSERKSINEKFRKTLYLMKLKELNKRYNSDATIRKATMNDLEFEKDMALKICYETSGKECSIERAYEIAKIYINYGLYFLINENGEIGSQVCTTKSFPNGYTLGAVYTPENQRRKGYARKCIYKVIEKIIYKGKNIIVLYSNTAKPENRSLYESLGFEIILEETIIKF